ncbi:uncharacterized protein LOC134194818 isoform X2 [Corticium candelabrum]|uniref:uncharacterized protein LOC134194818 isoform X2 n=1 Tax=Corticium candelabrum TaxID=121492 RepID=UPI002E276C81|nr:uncharacterized protein LOC134194818 isoform X2 [Corticium candelabrum]
MISHALAQSLAETDTNFSDAETLPYVLAMLRSNLELEEVTISLRRSHVLQDALRCVSRKGFPLNHTIKVEFLGEAGEDCGGPKREFFTLLSRQIQCFLFEGEDNRCVLRHDGIELQNKKFCHVGQLMAMSIVQGSIGFSFCAPPVYEYLCGKEMTDIKVEIADVPNSETRELLKQIEVVADDSTLQDICSSGIDVLIEAGYTKPVSQISLENKTEVAKTLVIHTLYRSKAVLDQLKSGLATLGLLDAMSKHPQILEPLFVFGNRVALTAETIKTCLLQSTFQILGLWNGRKKKRRTCYFLISYTRQKVRCCHSDASQYLRNVQKTRERKCNSLLLFRCSFCRRRHSRSNT